MLNEGKLVSISNLDSYKSTKGGLAPLDELPLYFHSPPSSYRVSGQANYVDHNVINYGTITTFGGRAQRTVSWEGILAVRGWYFVDQSERRRLTGPEMFPDYVWGDAVASSVRPDYVMRDADETITILEKVRDAGEPVKLEIWDVGNQKADWPIWTTHQGFVVCRSFEWWEEPHEPDARYYSISFTEWRALVIKRVPRITPKKDTKKPPKRIPRNYLPGAPKTYRVKENWMPLRDIAKLAYRDVSLTPLLIKANKGKLTRRSLVEGASPKGGLWYVANHTVLNIPDHPKHKGPARKPKEFDE